MRKQLDELIDGMASDVNDDIAAVGKYLQGYKNSCSDAEYPNVLLSVLQGIRDAAGFAALEVIKISGEEEEGVSR